MRGPSGLFCVRPKPPWRCGCLVPLQEASPSAFATRAEIVGVGFRASPPVSIASDLDEIEEDHRGLAFGMRRAGYHAAGRAASH